MDLFKGMMIALPISVILWVGLILLARYLLTFVN